MGFSRQEYWSWLPFPSPGDLPNPEIELLSPGSPTLAGRFFAAEPSESEVFEGERIPWGKRSLASTALSLPSPLSDLLA